MDFEFFGKGHHQIAPQPFLEQREAIIVDLRSDEEVALLPIRMERTVKTIHIPLHKLPDRLEEIPADIPVGLFCSADTRSAMALAYLRSHGYTNARILAGGYQSLVEELKPGRLFKRLQSTD
ncbi:MAG: rhodanese-like domain-containing protein [Deltaproteobacteria bacterium]|nr:rhodanese-like domain-containing protein [Deltaproteobacteria bacterium]